MSASSIFLPPSQTRLVTIAAHVDHGKTTLADNLIEHNGIISERLAGTLRYLDSDPEEQRRGITMRSSAIGLKHTHVKHKQQQNMIIHLLDSPGHTDFSTEVSSALLACDGALLVIDAVEGMGARTHQVLREAHAHQLVPVLVINKIDRLCTELCLTPTEAHLRLRNLFENVNAVASAMLTSAHQVLSEQQQQAQVDTSKEEELWKFDPARGNVIFASALFGWGFTAQSLARSLFRSKQIPIKPIVLKQYIFGDYKARGDKILKWKNTNESDNVPIFVEYALKPLWEIYEGVAGAACAIGLGSTLFSDRQLSSNACKKDARLKADAPGMEHVLQVMQVGATGSQVPTTIEEMQAVLTRTGASTEEAVLRSLVRRYRPLSETVLDVVSDYCPSPHVAAASVRSRVLALKEPEETTPEFERIQAAVHACDSSAESPCVAHVCKFMGTDKAHIRDPDLREDDGSNLILGLARVLSGRLRTGQEYYLMGPKHTCDSPAPPKRAIRLYLLMGSSFVRVDEVPAGHLCAIYNLEDIQLKTVTLCDSIHGMPLRGFDQRVRPLVKVNVEPQDAANTNDLERGLVKLSLADSGVEVTTTAKGETILACLGELHLEQSILDLENVYCGKEMKLRISDPIVDFGETTDWFDNEMDYVTFFGDSSPPLRQTRIPPYNEEEGLSYAMQGRMRSILSGRCAAISLRVIPLVASVYRALEEREVVEECEEDLLKIGRALKISDQVSSEQPTAEIVLTSLCDSLCALGGTNGTAIIESPGLRQGVCVRGVESDLGEVYVPRTDDGANAPQGENSVDESSACTARRNVYESLRGSIGKKGFQKTERDEATRTVADEAARKIWMDEMKGSAVAGFHHAIRAGPICEEPIRNVMVVLEGVEIAVQQDTDDTNGATKWKAARPLSGGMVVAALRTGIRCALLTRPARLMEGHLRLTLHSSLAGLGALYSVLSKRRGKVVDDSMVDGTDLLNIIATIPQAEAFGLAPELFGKTSGEVTAPEMVFSHWERLNVDPFWIPTSLEEREDFGELEVAGDASTGIDNTALHYIRQVRIRKGLITDSGRTVIAAEKQRTLKK